MARSQYHVVPADEGWGVEKDSKVLSSHGTKDEAISAGRDKAKADQPSQLVVHTRDGKIETEFTYQDDPFPPAG